MSLAGRGAAFVQRYGIYVLLLALIAFSTVFLETFRTAENAANLMKQSAILGLLAVGQTFVVVSGLIDLSVGMVAGLVVVLTCDLMAGQASMVPHAVGLALVLGAAVGAFNGTLYNLLRIDSLILTFGMLSVLQGAIFVYTDRSVGEAAPQIEWLANGTLAGIPAAGLVLLLVALLGHAGLARTVFGYHVYAVGGSPESARRAGIGVGRIHFWSFVISGVTAGLAGLLLAGRLGTGYPNAGQGLELDALVAVVLGGATLGGGRGTIAGSIAAVLVLSIASNVLNLLEISAFVQMLVKGLIVIAAIVASQRPQRAAA